MSTTDFEREVAYMAKVKHRNSWFDDKLTVKLTHEQVDQLIRHAYRAGVKDAKGAQSIFEQVFGGGK
jgi:hypothetical protein